MNFTIIHSKKEVIITPHKSSVISRITYHPKSAFIGVMFKVNNKTYNYVCNDYDYQLFLESLFTTDSTGKAYNRTIKPLPVYVK